VIPHLLVDEHNSKKFLTEGQVVRLQHTELGGCITADGTDFSEDGLAEVFLRRYKGEPGDLEEKHSGSLFELEQCSHLANQRKNKPKLDEESSEVQQDEKRRSVFDPLIAQESEDKGHLYRLRHLNTGRLMTI